MQRLPGQIQVSLIRTASPGDGTLTLIFADNPLTLRQWTVLDAQRQETRVTLYNVETGGKFDQKLFELVDPRFFQPNSALNSASLQQFHAGHRRKCLHFAAKIADYSPQ